MNPSRRSRDPSGPPSSQGNDKNFTTDSIWSSLGRLKKELRLMEHRLEDAGEADGSGGAQSGTVNIGSHPALAGTATIHSNTTHRPLETESGQPGTRRKIVPWPENKPPDDASSSSYGGNNRIQETAAPRNHRRERDPNPLNNHHHYQQDNHGGFQEESPKRVDFSRTNQLREVNWDGTYQDSLAYPPDQNYGSGSCLPTGDRTLTNSRDIRETDIHFLNFSRQPVSSSVGLGDSRAPTSAVSSSNGLRDVNSLDGLNCVTSPPFAPPPSLSGDSPISYNLHMPSSSSSSSEALSSSAGRSASAHSLQNHQPPHYNDISQHNGRAYLDQVRWNSTSSSSRRNQKTPHTVSSSSLAAAPASNSLSRVTAKSSAHSGVANTSSHPHHHRTGGPKLTKVEINNLASGNSASKSSSAAHGPNANSNSAELERRPKDFLHVRREVEEKWASAARSKATTKDPHGRSVNSTDGYDGGNSGGGDRSEQLRRDLDNNCDLPTAGGRGGWEREGGGGEAVDRKGELYQQLHHQRPRPMKKSITADLKDNEIMMKLKERLKHQRSLVTSSQSGSNDTSIADSTASSQPSASAAEPPALPPRQPLTTAMTTTSAPIIPAKTRKVAAAHTSPSYKGFSETVKDPSKASSTKSSSTRKKNAGTSTGKKPFTVQLKKTDCDGSKSGTGRHLPPPPPPPPPDRPKKPPARIVASADHKKHVKPGAKNIITTSSWRAGQEVILRELGSSNSTKPSSSKDSTKAQQQQQQHHFADIDNGSSLPPFSRQPDGAEALSSNSGNAGGATAVIGCGSSKNNDDDDDDDATNDVVIKSKNLYADAKNMLSELRIEGPVAKSSSSRPAVKRKAPKATAESEKHQQATGEKQRHYDPDSVRKYMQRQKTERLKKQQQECEANQKAKERKEQMMKELAMKQRQTAKVSGTGKGKTDGGEGGASGGQGKRSSKMDGAKSKGSANKENMAVSMDQDDESTLTEDEGESEDDSTPQITPREGQHDLAQTTSKSRKRSKEENHHTHAHHPQQDAISGTTATSPPRLKNPHSSTTGVSAYPSSILPSNTDSVMSRSNNQHPPPSKFIKFQGQNTDIDISTAINNFSRVLQRHQQGDVVNTNGGPSNNYRGDSISTHPTFPLGAESALPRGAVTNNNAHRTNEERRQALTATAMSLSNRIAEETRKLEAISDKIPGDRSQNSHKSTNPDYVSRYDRIIGHDGDFVVFGSDLPGVGPSYPASEERQEEAAARIQAAYRGHNVRQALGWELPSGATFGQRLRGVPQSVGRPSNSESGRNNSFECDICKILYRLQSCSKTSQVNGRRDDRGNNINNDEDDELEEEEPSPLTETSSFSEITATDVSEGVDGNKKSHHKKESRQHGEVPGHQSGPAASRSLWSSEPQPDPYSVMSVLVRQSKQYKVAGASAVNATTTTTTTTAGKNDPKSSAFVASLDLTSMKQPVITSEERVVVGQTSSGQPVIARARYTRVETTVLEKSPSLDVGDDDTQDGGSHSHSVVSDKNEEDLNDNDVSQDVSSPSAPALPSRQSHSHPGISRPGRSISLPSVHRYHSNYPQISDDSSSILTTSDDEEPERIKSGVAGVTSHKPSSAPSYLRQVSDAGLETDVSQLSDDEPRAMRSKFSAADSNVRHAPATDVGGATAGAGRGGAVSGGATGGRLSPNSLANKMATTLNYYESVEDSLRQLTGMERTRAVALAQQESVSLAQLLKGRQQEYTAEIRSLQLQAQQEVLESQKQLEQTRRGRTYSAATLLEKEDNRRPESRSNAMPSTVSRSSGGGKDLSQSLGNRRIHRSSATTSLASVTRRSEVTLSSRTPRDKSSATSASVKTAEDSLVDRGGNDSDSSIKTASDADALDSKRETSKGVSEHIEEVEESYSMSFDESVTDEESFRQVLPSESHRKEVVRRQSSEGSLNKSEVTNHMTPYTDLSSLFVGEDSFNRFTADMVRQIMREEEYRVQHQAALLSLREKALREKAKAELAWVKQKKQQPRNKGADDHFPNLDKTEKIIRRNLHEQQAEIRRLKEANKVASEERRMLLQQHEEIAKIQENTKETRQKLMGSTKQGAAAASVTPALKTKQPARPSHRHSDDEIEEASDISESLKDAKSDSEMYKEKGAAAAAGGGNQKIDKLDKLRLDQKYMTARQQRLEDRKKRAKELLEWKRKLDEEESEVFNIENAAMEAWGRKEGGGRKERGGKQQDKEWRKQEQQTAKKAPKPVPASKKDDSAVVSDRMLSSLRDETAVKSRSDREPGSISEVISTELSASKSATGTGTTDKKSRTKSERNAEEKGPGKKEAAGRRSPVASGSESSIPEEVPTGSNEKQKAHDSSDDTLINSSANDDYTDTFEPERSSSMAAGRKKLPVGKLLPQGNSPLPSPWSRKTGSESESEDSISHTETLSDASDYEVRIRQLSDELRRRRKEVEILKKERSRRQKDKLKAQEESLKKQLDAYNNYIQQLKSDKDVLEQDTAASVKSAVRPQIKQPRGGAGGSQTKSKHRHHSDDLANNSSSFDDSREGTDSNQASPSIDGKDMKLLVDDKAKKQATVSLMDRISEGSESQSDKSGGSGKQKAVTANKKEDSRQPVSKSKTDDLSEKTTSSSVQEAIEDASHFESIRSDRTASGMLKIDTATPATKNRKSESLKEDDASYSMDFSENLSTLAQSHNRAPASARSQASSIHEAMSKGKSEVDISEHIDEASVASSIHSPSVSNQLKFDFMHKPTSKPASDYSQGSLMSPPATGIQESDSETESRINSNHTSAKSEGSSRPSSEKSVGSVFSVEDEEEEEDIASYNSDKATPKASASKLLPPVMSGTSLYKTDEEVSISASLPSISEKRQHSSSLRQESQDVLDSLLGFQEGEEEEDDDEKTPVPTPREMALSPDQEKSEDDDEQAKEKRDDRNEEEEKEAEEEENLSLLMTDPLADFHLEDRVFVWGRRPGVLKFKGKVEFSPGIWAGVELDTDEGDSDGIHENKRYFTCRPGHGIMVHGSDISSFDGDKDARQEIIGVEDMRSPDESLTTDQEDNGIDALIDGIDTSALPAGDSSMLHSTPVSSPFAKNGSGRGLVQKPNATPVKGNDASVDSITDHLTASIVQDSVEAMGKIASRKSSSPTTPPATLPKSKKNPPTSNEISASSRLLDDFDKSGLDQSSAADKTTNGVMDSLLNEAISHMVSIKRRKAGIAGKEPDTSSFLLNGQLEEKDISKLASADRKINSSASHALLKNEYGDDDDEEEDDDDEDEEDEKINDNDSGLSLDPVQRPGSPLPGDGGITADERKELNEDMNNLFEEYIDDDLGFEPSPSSAKPQPSFSGDQTSAMSPEASGYMEEIAPVIPHTKDQIAPIIQQAVDVYWQRRRYGESLDTPIDPPHEFLEDIDEDEEGGSSALDALTASSHKSWRRMLFDLTGEVIRDIYKDEDKMDPPAWQKAKHKTQKYFKGSAPPTTVDALRPLVEGAVFQVLDLNGMRRQNHTVNKWNIRKKKDAVDAVLVQELGEEEKGWVDYNHDELNLKISLTDAIFDSLIADTARTFNGIYQRSQSQV